MITVKINGKTRRPSKGSYYIGVKSDNNADSVMFRIPRLVGDIDLVDYTPILVIQRGGFSDAAQLEVIPDGDTATVTYEISGALMSESGTAICKLKFVALEDNELCVWNSENIFFAISDTLSADDLIEQKSYTLLEQFTAQIADISQTLNVIQQYIDENCGSGEYPDYYDELNDRINDIEGWKLSFISYILMHVDDGLVTVREDVRALQDEILGVSALQQENLGLIGG